MDNAQYLSGEKRFIVHVELLLVESPSVRDAWRSTCHRPDHGGCEQMLDEADAIQRHGGGGG